MKNIKSHIIALTGLVMLFNFSCVSKESTTAIANSDNQSNVKQQVPDVPENVPYGVDPITPSQAALIAISKVEIDSLKKIDGVLHFEGEVYNGWAYKTYVGNGHMYRYIKYIDGKKVWQIGYYESGNLDHDFHIYQGLNKGSQRMWRDNGTPYINNYFLEGEKMHGLQRRWNDDNILVMKSEYNNGQLVYEKNYDQQGNPIEN